MAETRADLIRARLLNGERLSAVQIARDYNASNSLLSFVVKDMAKKGFRFQLEREVLESGHSIWLYSLESTTPYDEPQEVPLSRKSRKKPKTKAVEKVEPTVEKKSKTRKSTLAAVGQLFGEEVQVSFLSLNNGTIQMGLVHENMTILCDVTGVHSAEA